MRKKKFDSSKYPIQFDYELHLGNMKNVAQKPESFTGRTADSDRAVMLALVEWALGHRAYTIHPGVRGIALNTGKSPATVSKANRRLQQKGWIEIIYKPGTFDAKAQQIELKWNQDKFLNSVDTVEKTKFILNVPDIWTSDGLGVNAKIVMATLIANEEGKRLYQLASLTNLSPKQNQTALSKLLKAGLVEKSGRIYKDISPMDDHGQRNIAQAIRMKWTIDEKEQARQERFENDRYRRAKTLTSVEVQRIQIEKYRNYGKLPRSG
jgi:DNA-binding transcriptional regulator YhcF (GntR family)